MSMTTTTRIILQTLTGRLKVRFDFSVGLADHHNLVIVVRYNPKQRHLSFLLPSLWGAVRQKQATMEVFYYLVFGVMAIFVAVLELSNTNKERINTSSAFNSFKNNYLLIFSIMMGKNFHHFFVQFDFGYCFGSSARSNPEADII